jgi:hypothetical protein
MYCNHCGKLNLDGANFCTQCGERLITTVSPPVNPVSSSATDQPIKQPAPSGFLDKLKSDYGFLAIAVVVCVGHMVWSYWRDHQDKDIMKQESLYKTIYIISNIAIVLQFIFAVLFTKNLFLRIIIALIGIWVCYNAFQMMQESFYQIFDKRRLGED